MNTFGNFGSIFLLFAIVDYISFAILGTVSYIQVGVFPYQMFFNTFSLLMFGVGFFMSLDIIKELKFNPLSIFKFVFSAHYNSLIFLAIFSLIIAIATNFNELSIIRGIIYFAIWSSARTSR